MNNLITPLSDIQKEVNTIQDFLEITPSEEIREIEDRGNQLIVYLARTSKLLADAKYHKDEKLNSAFVKEIENINLFKSAMVSKSYIDSLCKDENYLINHLERLNRAVTHAWEWSRSMLSKATQEYRYNHFNK